MFRVKFKSRVLKSLDKIDKNTLNGIKKCLEKIKKDPYVDGQPLKGKFKGLWRYRVNDYRIVCEIKNKELTILVLKVGHRKEIYD